MRTHWRRRVFGLLGMSLLVALLLMTAAPVFAQEPTIDGVISPGEWDDHYLGQQTHGNWTGGPGAATFNVYGYRTSTHLFLALEMVSYTGTRWPWVCQMSIPGPNLYLKSPACVSWPEPGYTYLTPTGEGCPASPPEPWVIQTDGSDWACYDSWADAGVDAAITTTCSPDVGVAEYKIPWTAFSEGAHSPVKIGGQYWGYNVTWDEVQPPYEYEGSLADCLLLSKVVSPSAVAPGEEATFTIEVTNDCACDVDDVVVTDELGAGLTLVGVETTQGTYGVAGQVVTVDVGTVAAGDTVTIDITVIVGASGTTENTAWLTTDVLGGVEIPASTQVRGEAFVPEPGSILLLGSGLAGLAGYAALRLRSGQNPPRRRTE